MSAGNSGSNPMHPESGYDGKNKEQVTTVNIFPSPFSDYLMIDFNIAQKSYFNMELYNTIGELIVRKGMELDAGKRNVSFQNLDNLPSGVYILEVTDADGRKWVFKTIKS